MIFLGALLLGATSSAGATEDGDDDGPSTFGDFSLAVHAGFQLWRLEGLEQSLEVRNASYAADGFQLKDPAFGPGLAFGAELQFRLTPEWFLFGGGDWTRMTFDDRDRRTLGYLGGSDRTPVSLVLTTRVETAPALFRVGLGRAFEADAVRFGLSGGALIAPVRVRDEFEFYLEQPWRTSSTSKGTGIGWTGTISADYLNESNMTLFLEGFFQAGSADVELEVAEWESSSLPGVRRVEFTGGGLRVGIRWI
ncbi:MAG: hypothetical protein KC591_13040 [Gemmatimonadetes bacterium]|nr:hypothetical protein [Gemmatimonadota bacterium]